MRSKELCLVQENHATVKPDSSVTHHGMKTNSKSKIELRNLQILKCLQSQVNFCHQSSPGNRKARTLPRVLQELKKYPRKASGWGQPRSHLIRVLNERSVSDSGNFCLLWLAILKSV